MKSYIIYTFIFNGDRKRERGKANHAQYRIAPTHSLTVNARKKHGDEVQNSFVIIFTSFVILPERFYPANSVLSQKDTNVHTHTHSLAHSTTHTNTFTFYGMILLVSFIYFMTVVLLWQSHCFGRHLCNRAAKRFLSLVFFFIFLSMSYHEMCR